MVAPAKQLQKNSKDGSESRTQNLFLLSFVCHWSIFSSIHCTLKHVIAGFQNNF
jgi:hypothetical protein